MDSIMLIRLAFVKGVALAKAAWKLFFFNCGAILRRKPISRVIDMSKSFTNETPIKLNEYQSIINGQIEWTGTDEESDSLKKELGLI